jgi:hypothetical protein
MKKKFVKPTAMIILVAILSQILTPTVSYALTGGPSQPEVQSFEPVGTSEMVDLFSGDFNYNIPLLDVDGYPLNIAYHSGITMDQEASWVGLGWNLNPGVVNRNLRGVPDDFKGDEIVKSLRHKDNFTLGVNYAPGLEGFGLNLKKDGLAGNSILKKGKWNLGMNMGIFYNNYKGIGFDFGIRSSFKSSVKGIPTRYGLSLSNNSQSGATVQPNVSLGERLGGQLGPYSLNLNSKDGLKAMNYGYASISSFNTPAYIPYISMPMKSYTGEFSLKMGTEANGFYKSKTIGGYFHNQSLIDDKVSVNAFGSQFLHESHSDKDMLDYSREKDGQFSKESPVLAVPAIANDFFNYSGQGIGGTFKAFRGGVTVISDPESRVEPGYGGKLGFEIGGGGTAKYGMDVTFNYFKSSSSPWKNSSGKKIAEYHSLSNKGNNTKEPLFEPYYFKSLGEKNLIDPNFSPIANSENDFLFLPGKGRSGVGKIWDSYTTKGRDLGVFDLNYKGSLNREKRDNRNTLIQVLKVDEKDFCVEKRIYYYKQEGSKVSKDSIERNAGHRKGNHNSELTVVRQDGSKYVYGIAAYNTSQKEFDFTNALDMKTYNSPNKFCSTGEVQYDPSFNDFQGIDKHKETIETPAYAHSYLLTNVLGSDYYDIDGNGPSENDFGTYTKINYSLKNSNYKWRVPYTYNRANLDHGLRTDKFDDRANIIYGTKELWHVHSIEGKNHIAYFYTSPRLDGHGVLGETGGFNHNADSYKLDSIILFAKTAPTIPIKTVVFKYDYYLCPKVPNNRMTDSIPSSGNTGKLTLRVIYFKYGSSNKGRFNSYKFSYNDGNASLNAPYHLKGYDAWGNYKPAIQKYSDGSSSIDTCNPTKYNLSKDFPYVEQTKVNADKNTAQWNLSKITMPSGGTVEMEYESDDYAYVQNKKAMQMYRLLGFAKSQSDDPGDKLYDNGGKIINNFMFVEVPSQAKVTDIIRDFPNIQFNVLTSIDGTDENAENIRGYADIVNVGELSSNGSTKTIWIELKKIKLNDTGLKDIHPIAGAAFNFLRLNLPQIVNPESDNIKGSQDNVLNLAKTLVGLVGKMVEMLKGQDTKLANKGLCSIVYPAQSWVRLSNFTGYKFGGGSRVKRIISGDNWGTMEGSGLSYRNNKYTQEFTYTTKDGQNEDGSDKIISSGVASWEPPPAGDENPFRQLDNRYQNKKTFVPDPEYFSEWPQGESYAPSAMVGYSMVTVKNTNGAFSSSEFTRNGTGKVVNEFYTARDYPTIFDKTQVQIDAGRNSLIWTMLFISSEKSTSMAQNFVIELNDMHGKPKSIMKFSQAEINSNDPSHAYSGTRYEYFDEPHENGRRLKNEVNVVEKDGIIKKGVIGQESEIVVDTRQFNSKSFSGGIELNLDVTAIPLIAGLTGIPNLTMEDTWFQSGVSVKVTNKYGIIKRISTFENGAKLNAENTVFDALTGEVVVSKVQNEFEDYHYNSTYPAHWVYEGMGPASINQGAILKLANASGYLKVNYLKSNVSPELFLYHGDQIQVLSSNAKLWVYKLNASVWVLMDANGSYVEPFDGDVKVIRSGRANMPTTPVAKFEQLQDPALTQTLINTTKVINASVQEFDSTSKIQNNFTPPIITKCLADEAHNLLNYLFINRYFTPEKLDTLGVYWANGRYISFNPDTLPSWDHLKNSEYCKLMKKLHPGEICRIKLFGNKYIGESQTQYSFGFMFDPIDYQSGCTNYKFSMESNGYTQLPDAGRNKSYPLNSQACPPSQQFPNYCANDYSTSIDPYLPFDGVISSGFGANYSCDCTPTYNSGNISEDPSTGICFSGSLSHYASKNGYSNLSNLPKPYSNFCQDCRGRGMLKQIFTCNPYYAKFVRNVIFYVTSQYKETNKCTQNPVVVSINPFNNGLQNNWKPKRSWAYVAKRIPNSASTNVRVDGTIDGFTNFWQQSPTAQRPIKQPNQNWVSTNEVTKYHPAGGQIESKNALGILSSTIYGYNNTLPIAQANNAAYNQILALNFENESNLSNTQPVFISSNASHLLFELQKQMIDTNHYHSGFSSYKIADTVRLSAGYLNNQIQTKLNLITASGTTYQTKSSDYIGVFEPSTGKYVLSAWVKVTQGNSSAIPSIQFLSSTENPIIENGSANTISQTFYPSGPIIDGWQKIEGLFTIESNKKTFLIKLFPGTGQIVNIDDLRIQPFNSEMNTYVYDPMSYRMAAELDANNFATFYEYDKEGNLIRIKRETERGIVTVKESKSGFLKSNPVNP